MTARPHDAYRKTAKLALRPREAEAEALRRAAAALERAQQNPGDRGAAIRALRFNQMLWTVLQAGLMGKGGLPDALKRDILSLSVFVDRETVAQFRAPAPGRLEALIAIDRALAQGLA